LHIHRKIGKKGKILFLKISIYSKIESKSILKKGENSFWQSFVFWQKHHANNAIFFLFFSIFAKKIKVLPKNAK
jgi:hypothetical protein